MLRTMKLLEFCGSKSEGDVSPSTEKLAAVQEEQAHLRFNL